MSRVITEPVILPSLEAVDHREVLVPMQMAIEGVPLPLIHLRNRLVQQA